MGDDKSKKDQQAQPAETKQLPPPHGKTFQGRGTEKTKGPR